VKWTWIDRVVLLAALAAGAALRLWLASRGHNYDMRAWRDFADIAAQHRNIYLATDRYNYPPTWFLVLGGLDWLHNAAHLARLGPESFHIVIASFLTLADIGIAALLLRAFGRAVALVFFLNPALVLLTGHHSQFDNLALLPALASWLALRRGSEEVAWPRAVGSAALMGLSLAIKHILFFFPIWLLISRDVLRAPAKRLAFAAISYAIFLGSFVPFLFTPGAAQSVMKNVVGYARYSPTALMVAALDVVVPIGAVDHLFGLLPPHVSGVKYLFHVCMLAAGWCLARRRWLPASELFVAYLCSMLIFATVMNQNYLAIPLIACAIHWRRAASWVYLALAAALAEMGAYLFGALPGPPWWHEHLPGLSYRHAVVWLVVLLVSIATRPQLTPRAAWWGSDG
jgi:hypothetical protein